MTYAVSSPMSFVTRCLALAILAPGPAFAAVEITKVHLLSVAPGSETATAKPKFVKTGESVELVVAIEAKVDGKAKLFAGATSVEIDGKKRRADPWPEAEPVEVAWFKVEPTADYVDNEAGGFHWDPIPYSETPWPLAGKAALARPADVRTTVLPDRGGLGTMTFKVAVTAGGKTLATTGKEDVYRGGLSAKVHRV